MEEFYCFNLEDAEEICKKAYLMDFYDYVNGCDFTRSYVIYIYLTKDGYLKSGYYKQMKRDSVKVRLYELQPSAFDGYYPIEGEDDIDQDAEDFWDADKDRIMDAVTADLVAA